MCCSRPPLVGADGTSPLVERPGRGGIEIWLNEGVLPAPEHAGHARRTGRGGFDGHSWRLFSSALTTVSFRRRRAPRGPGSRSPARRSVASGELSREARIVFGVPATTTCPPWRPPRARSPRSSPPPPSPPIVLDHDHRVADVAQMLEGGEQLAVVALVQSDRRLVEHVDHARQLAADLAGEADALPLAAGERRRRPVRVR